MFNLKYRPQKISEIDNGRGRNLIANVLSSETLPQAFLFVGQKGTGKTSAARILAKAVNCLENKYSDGKHKGNGDYEPCNRCSNCLSINSSSFTDVIEMDAASNRGIDEIKSLIRETSFMPMSGHYRVFIIDEAHMITNEGFNALLKTLEEPPATAIFILATTNQEKLPKTIVSRCFRINFGKASDSDIVSMLRRICVAEKLDYPDELLKVIASHSDNSFRDAAKILEEISLQKISGLDQLEAFLGIRGRFNLLDLIEKRDSKKTFEWIGEFNDNGGNFKALITDILENLRVQLLIHKGMVFEGERKLNLTVKDISMLIRNLLEAYQLMRTTPIESLPLELAVAEFYNVKSS